MYIDNELVLEEGMAIVASDTSDYASGCVDLGVAGRDVGAGRPMYCVINVTTDFASADTATIQFQLLEDAGSGIDSDSIVLLETEKFVYDTLTAGRELIVIPVPPGVALRYIGLGVLVVNETTAGTIDAYLTINPQTNP